MSKRGWRILLGDDDPIVQETVKHAAEAMGHRVTAATTGAQTLQLAIMMQPDLIVLDMEFPDADGRDVLAKLKAEKRTAGIPVLVWSARRANDSDSRIALDLGAEDYVEKNDAQLLIRKLERVPVRFEKSA